MDHIPDIGPHEIRVPFLEGTWDGGDFSTYAERRQYLKDNELQDTDSDGKKLDPLGRMRLLQTWLFFGLIEEVMRVAGIEVDTNDFIKPDEQGPTITTRNLPWYLIKLLEFERVTSSGTAERCHKIMSYLRTVSMWAELHYKYGDENEDVADKEFVRNVGGPVLLSLSQASLALSEACTAIYKDDFIQGTGVVRQLVGARFLRDLMLADGWCPSHITKMLRLGNRELLYSAYTYGLHNPESLDHSHCYDGFCKFNQIDEDTYRPQHRDAGCNCEVLEIDRQKLESIVLEGGIPVCRLLRVTNGERPEKYRIEVEAASGDRPYIAISHVWAHGLGNPTQNGLPLCSLQAIQNWMDHSWHRLGQLGIRHPRDELGCRHGFWMDTLCVPVHPSAKALRKKAIAQMRDIYGGAVSVFVLDKTLQSRTKWTTLSEGLLSLMMSSWTTRLWTLQEAVLAKRVFVLMGDGMAFDLDQLVHGLVNQLTGKVSLVLFLTSPYLLALFTLHDTWPNSLCF